MAWTVPRTWVAGETVTAAIMNAHVRDNQNALVGSRSLVSTDETTTSTTFVDLATSGPAVTVTTLTTAYLFLSCKHRNNTAGDHAIMGFAVSGATTIAASSDIRALIIRSNSNNFEQRQSKFYQQTGLTAGSNTFTAKYNAVGGGTADFQDREMIVIPVGVI